MRELEQRIESREVAEIGGCEKRELTVTSLEVAKMVVGKEHSKLLRDIKRYSNQLAEANIGLSEFFREGTYKDSTRRTLPCYEITKKGCEFIAHKLTGTKGTAFTAKYINRFYEMESKLLSQTPASLSENDMEILAEKVAERLFDRSRKTTEAENRYIYPEHGSSILSIGFCRGGR